MVTSAQCRGDPCHPGAGFTLIELVVVIVIVSILAGVVAPLIARPTAAFIAETRRGALIDTAETALDRMSEEIRLAVPNSVRIDATSHAVEFLRTVDGGRYRARDRDKLDFTTPDASLDIIGNLTTCAQLDVSPLVPDCANGVGYCMVVDNLGAGTASDAYAGNNIAPIQSCVSGGAVAGDGSDHITLASSMRFPQPSPNQRFQIVDTPITFLCDTRAKTLRLYEHYEIRADQADVDSAAELTGLPVNPAESSLLAQGVSACKFGYDAAATHLLTVSLTIARDNDSITLRRKIRVPNQP